MVFYTISKSVYEVDMVHNRIRRLRGIGDPSPRVGKDGEWRQYAWISPIAKTLPVLITWTSDVKARPGYIPTTLTSPVDHVSSEEN